MSWRYRGRYYSHIVTISEYPMGQVLLGFFGEYWEIFKRNFFTEHLWTTACEEYYFTRVLCSKTLRKGIWYIFKAYRIIVQISLMNFRSCLGLLRIVPLDFFPSRWDKNCPALSFNPSGFSYKEPLRTEWNSSSPICFILYRFSNKQPLSQRKLGCEYIIQNFHRFKVQA